MSVTKRYFIQPATPPYSQDHPSKLSKSKVIDDKPKVRPHHTALWHSSYQLHGSPEDKDAPDCSVCTSVMLFYLRSRLFLLRSMVGVVFPFEQSSRPPWNRRYRTSLLRAPGCVHGQLIQNPLRNMKLLS